MRYYFRKMFYPCFVMCFTLALLSNCVPSQTLIKSSASEFDAVKSGSVGVGFFDPNKRFLFSEQIYLVLGYRMKEDYKAYVGIWDPMPSLKDKVLEELRKKYLISAITVDEVMSKDALSSIRQTLEEKYNETRIQGRAKPGGLISSSDDEYQNGHYNKFLHQKLPDQVLTELRKHNINYFLEIYLGSINYKDPSAFDWIYCTVATYSRLNRVSDGAIIWLNKSIGGTILKNIQSLSDLEKDNMSLLKQGYQQALSSFEVLKDFSPQ